MARTASTFRGPAIGAPTFVPNVAYSGALDVDVWKPAVADRPIVIVLHGGGWDTGTEETVPWPEMAAYFAELGFAVFNADYTLTGGAPQDPIDDVLELVQWVRDNAATYHGDPTRVTIVGVSAGAHLGVMAALQGVAGASAPDAVVGWSTPSDLEEAYGQGNGPATLGVGGYIGVALSGNEATYRLYSPVDQMHAGCCPLRLVASDTEDTSVSGSGLAVVQTTSLVAAAEAVGVTVESRIFSGTIHGFFHGGTYGSSAANDMHGTCAWIIETLGESVPAFNRTASSGRVASSARQAA
jgi:acetyl esterase/lipase